MGLFKKLFGRKSKQSNDDENAAIVSNSSSSSKKEKQKFMKKKKKKKDKLAHFPSKEQPLATAHDVPSNQLMLMHDETKENGNGNPPAAAMSPARRTVPQTRNSGGKKGVLSDRLSALSPRNFMSMEDAPVVPMNTDVTETGAENVADLENFGNKRGNKENSPHPLVSPTMSGNKPPLTPNRIASIRGLKPLTPSNNRLPLSPQTVHSNRVKSTIVDLDLELETHNAAIAQKENALEREREMSPSNESLRGETAVPSFGSDDMCLSSDNEDDDYNRIVSGVAGGKPAATKGKEKDKGEKFVSALDRSPFSYASDDDNALFPALVDDKDPFATAQDPALTANDVANSKPAAKKVAQLAPISTSANPEIVPMSHETREDMRAWTPSPTKKSSFTFSGNDKLSSPSPRSLATPPTSSKSAGQNASRAQRVLFDNFAEFAEFKQPFEPEGKRRSHRSSNSVSHIPFSPVSALMDEKRRSRRETSRGGSASINSEPLITASYLRHARKSSQGADSMSRVIDNLELHVNKRQHSNTSKEGSTENMTSVASSHRSVDRSVDGAVREAKERMRQESIANESRIIDMLASSGSGGGKNSGKQSEDFLFDEVTGLFGPRSVAADLESLGGRSNRSGRSKNSVGNKSHRSHRSRHGRRHKSDESVDSRASRRSGNSYRSYQTTKSMVSQMSEASRSVTNDLLRLEAQLSMVGKRSAGGGGSTCSGAVSEHGKLRDDCGMTVVSRDFSHGRNGTLPLGASKNISASARRAAAVTLRSKITVVAPPGKLGIILANRTDSRGTVVSGVRTSSVLAEQVSPGDRIIAIDDEDVSQMNVKEITTIMARKSEFDRELVLLATPRHQYD